MALSLSAPQAKSAIHSPTQSNTTTLFYSTPRRFCDNAVQDENSTSQEVLPAMSRGQVAPLLLLPVPSNFQHTPHDGTSIHRLASPNQATPDLPSWTPLRVPEGDEGSSASEVDEPSAEVSTRGSKTTQPGTTKHPGSAGFGVPVDSTSHPTRSKQGIKKKARFAGVVIVSKHRRPTTASGASHSYPVHRGQAASQSNALSLVDALKHTFDANKHVEGAPPRSLPRASGLDRLRPTPDQDEDCGASTAPQTDVEAGSTTEPDDERPQLSNRLLAPHTPKKHLTRARAIALSESNNESEDASSVSRDTSVRPERPAKRLKPISYDAYAALIDASLGTVQAPVSWDAEPDFISKDETVIGQPRPSERTSTDVPMDVDTEVHTANSAREGLAAPPRQTGAAENPWRTPALRLPRKAALSPHIPRGDRFKERLVAMFGENATVRMDRAARPKPAAIDLFASMDDLDREPSPNPSESSASEGSASTAEERMSPIPSTQVTSQSPDLPPTSSPSTSLGISENHEPNENRSVVSMAMFVTSEEQISGWITALQRLVKGKVRVGDEDLETLSVVLAEIDSVKDGLDGNNSTIVELHESLKQLSELHEIPFGDRNNLRRRATRILLGWPSSARDAN